MKKPVKRPRGGASILCPKCQKPSRVVETRRVALDIVPPTTEVWRWRVCAGKKSHRFQTKEIVQ